MPQYSKNNYHILFVFFKLIQCQSENGFWYSEQNRLVDFSENHFVRDRAARVGKFWDVEIIEVLLRSAQLDLFQIVFLKNQPCDFDDIVKIYSYFSIGSVQKI